MKTRVFLTMGLFLVVAGAALAGASAPPAPAGAGAPAIAAVPADEALPADPYLGVSAVTTAQGEDCRLCLQPVCNNNPNQTCPCGGGGCRGVHGACNGVCGWCQGIYGCVSFPL